MGKLKRVFIKTKRNPRYLGYYVRNISKYIMQRYVPSIYGFFKPKDLDLGQPCGLRKLHVILRTTDTVMNINAPRNLDDIGIVTRNDVIRVGGCSLFKAGAQFAQAFGKENLRITIIADRLSEVGRSQYQEAAKAVNLPFEFVEAKGHGSRPSFQSQIDIALQDDDETLALILEDDYQLDEDAFTTCFRVMRDHANVIGMNPHFHPDRIRRHDTGKLAVIDGKLYGQIFNTCCTFFMPVSQIKRYEKHLRVFECWEDGSINAIWKKGICLSPLGWTMSEALHRSELSPVTTLFKTNQPS